MTNAFTESDATSGTTTNRSPSSIDDDPATLGTPVTSATSAAGTEYEAQAAASAPEPSDPADRLFGSTVILPGSPEASPDGAWLAYLLDDEEGATHLWLSPTDGGDAQRVALPFAPVEERDPDSGRTLRGPQWSPDGATIALSGTHPDGDRLAIWLVPAAASSTVFAASPAEPAPASSDAPSDPSAEPGDSADPPSGPSDAPEGADLADADGLEPEATPEVTPLAAPVAEAAAPAPREPRLLAHSSGSDRSPRWSPDGTRIAFISHRDRRDVIALATPDGEYRPGRAELLTWSSSHDREPSWSRDGRFLAFTRQRGDGPEHADILVFILDSGELKNLTSEKASAVRHSLDWVPGRNLIAYVTLENDWLSISVVNADNKAGWTVTRESGDKTDPRFGPTEPRMLYVRGEGFATVCCERGLHASGAIALDPGEGVVTVPRWLADKRVVYGFSAPQRPFGFLAQENLADAERTALPVPGAIAPGGVALRQPIPFEFQVGEDEQFSGMFYRSEGAVEPGPGIVYLPDGPLRTRTGEFRIEEQALASTGIMVFAPVLHGASGFGFAVEQDLADFADTELEISDIAEAGRGLGVPGSGSGVDAAMIALVGHGFGGTLALLTAGARPGIYSAVVAIDPVTDWPAELESADVAWRNWVTRQYGLPRTNPDRYALRSPATFGAVIDVPLTLISTSAAPPHRRAQLAAFMAYLAESSVEAEHIDAGDEPLGAILRGVSKRLAARYLNGRESVEIVTDLRADDIG